VLSAKPVVDIDAPHDVPLVLPGGNGDRVVMDEGVAGEIGRADVADVALCF